MPDRESMDDRLRELVALGREHFQRGDYSVAAGHLEQVVSLGARFADVQHMLGVIYHQLGEFEPAQRAFEKALEINPDYTEASLNLAIVYNDLGQYERAQQVYGNAMSRARGAQKREPNGDEPLDPYTRGKIANLHAAVGDGYLSVRRPGDAAAEYRRALALCPTFVDLRLKLAQGLLEGGDLDGALAELRLAIQHSPSFLPARVALGTTLYASGKLDEAVAQWEEVLRIDAHHRTAGMYLKLARSQARKGRP
jgi:tetratricopeptide (TPR) repeat protein